MTANGWTLAPGPIVTVGSTSASGSIPWGTDSARPWRWLAMVTNAANGSATRTHVVPRMVTVGGTTTADAAQAVKDVAVRSRSRNAMSPVAASSSGRAAVISRSPSPHTSPSTSAASSRTVAMRGSFAGEWQSLPSASGNDAAL
jgi:hypothetical protein